MLAASKDKVLAELKQQSLCLRQLELEYYIKRYTNIATQCVIIAGFAYDSLVEITISARMQEERPAVCTVYYAASSCTMAFAMYTVYVASFATVFGHRLALQGPIGSVDRAVAVMMMQRTSIFVTFGLAMLSLVASAVTMAWIRMDATGMGEIPGVVTGLFGLFLLALLWKNQYMKASFLIPDFDRTQGDVRLNFGAEEVDASRLEAGSGQGRRADGAGPSNAPPPPTRPRGGNQGTPFDLVGEASCAAAPPSRRARGGSRRRA